jgi:RNase P subunit RPR2
MASPSSMQNDQPAVLCPRCERAMLRGPEKPIMFTSGLSDVTYTCESCNTETVRTIRGDGSRHTAGMVDQKA